MLPLKPQPIVLCTKDVHVKALEELLELLVEKPVSYSWIVNDCMPAGTWTMKLIQRGVTMWRPSNWLLTRSCWHKTTAQLFLSYSSPCSRTGLVPLSSLGNVAADSPGIHHFQVVKPKHHDQEKSHGSMGCSPSTTAVLAAHEFALP